jgi:putative ABC transport system permease protein
MSATLKKALADVTRRKGRTLLVVLGILIGIFGLTAINFTEDTLTSAYAFATGYHANQPDITLNVDRLDSTLVPQLEAVPNVAIVQFDSIFRTQWNIGSGSNAEIPLAIWSAPDLNRMPLIGMQLTDGRYPNAGEVLMEYGDRNIRPFAIGGTISVETTQGMARLRVVGIVRTPGFGGIDHALAYMSDAGLQQIAGSLGVNGRQNVDTKSPSLVNEINVKMQNAAQATTAVRPILQILQSQGVQIFNINTGRNPNLQETVRAIEGISAVLRMLALIAIIGSGILILNTVSTLIAEQIGIIGTMKALGGTRRVILRGYLISIGIYSMLATLPGIALGIYAGYRLSLYLGNSSTLDIGSFTISPWIIPLSLAVGIGVPMLAALIPLWNGIRISIRDALAAYGVNSGQGNDLLARLGQRIQWIPQITWLGLRSIFRKRWRAVLTVTVLTITSSCFLVVQSAVTSINDTVEASIAHASDDITARFTNPVPFNQVQQQLSSLQNVQRIERSDGYNAMTQWGTVNVLGWESNTRIYHYQMTSGRWLRADDTNVVLLSDDVAQRSGLHTGDSLKVVTQNGISITLTVIGTLKQSITVLGWIGAIVVPVNIAYTLRGMPADQIATNASEVSIEARDRSSDAVYQLANQVSTVINSDGFRGDGSGYFIGSNGTVDTLHEYTTRRQGGWYILYYMLYSIALLIGVIGVLGLADMLVSSVYDRQREIGLLRALGANSRKIAHVFWIEGLSLGAISFIAGLAIGLPLAYAFVRFLWAVAMPIDFYIDGIAFIVLLVAILSIATLASIAPAWHASRMRIANILRYE